MSDRLQAAQTPRLAIVNIGAIVSGDWRAPRSDGDTIIAEDGLIRFIGFGAVDKVAKSDVVIDAAGATAIPGLIDSHVHISSAITRRASARSAILRVTSMAG